LPRIWFPTAYLLLFGRLPALYYEITINYTPRLL